MRRSLLFMLALLLTGCSQRYLVNDDPTYAYNLPPVGSRIVLKKPLRVPGGETRIFLQGGEAMKKSEFDRYKASCSFELRKLADTARNIEPDSFLVTEVQRLTQEVVQRKPAFSGFLKVAMQDSGGKPMVTQGYHLWLGSEKQPDVMRMTCRGAFDDLSRADPPSLEEVKQSLGDYAELIMPI
jgi:hypothetical protein